MKLIFTLFALLMIPCLISAQDVHFSQFYESSILRNPALMGTYKGDYKIGAEYRSQWSSISKPFTTGLITGETRIPVKGQSGDYFTAGMLAYVDRAGSIDLQTIAVYPAISFTKYLGDESRTFLTAGFTGGFIQRSFDPSKITTNMQYLGGTYNPTNPTGETFGNNRISNWDLGAGVALNSAANDEKVTYYLGFSGYHFTRPKVSFYNNSPLVNLNVKWNGAAGFSYRFSEQYGFQFHTNYQLQGVNSELIAGGLIGWKRISSNQADPAIAVYGGFFYRIGDAAIPTFKLDYKMISITASYDFTTSKLNPANNGYGGLELSIMHTGLFNNAKYERSRTICPKPW